jgi:ParD-like antitoxin of type II bacterial toxin-antitoxin system
MSPTIPTRVTIELFETAKVVGDMTSRSAAQQIEHWARIGREIELASTLAQRDIAAVLAGTLSYDALGTEEQAVVRAEWARLMRERRESLDLRTDFLLRGETYVDLDEEGRVVRHAPDGSVIEIIAAADPSTD